MEQVWQWLRQHCLSNRVFDCYEQIVEQISRAWNTFIEDTGRVKSLCFRRWIDQGLDKSDQINQSSHSQHIHSTISHGGERHLLIKHSLIDGWSAKQLGCELRGTHCASSFGLHVKSCSLEARQTKKP
jgi:hypothetical protein